MTRTENDGADWKQYGTDWDGYEHPSTAIVEALADAFSCEPTEIVPLHQYVDGDALDRLLCDSESRVTITFEYDDVWVHVDSSNLIEIRTEA